MGGPCQPRFHVLALNLSFLIYDIGLAAVPLAVGWKVRMRPFKSHARGQCSVNGDSLLWLAEGAFGSLSDTPAHRPPGPTFCPVDAAGSVSSSPPWEVVGIPDPSGPLLAPLERELAGWGVGRHPPPICFLLFRGKLSSHSSNHTG